MSPTPTPGPPWGPFFQAITRGDAARTWFLTTPRDGNALHSAYWLEIRQGPSGSDLSNEDYGRLRRLIVTAVNSHAELVAALTKAMNEVGAYHSGFNSAHRAKLESEWAPVRALLSRVKGETL